MELLSFLAFIDNFRWYHWVVIGALGVVIILAVLLFRINTKTQMKVSFNMDDETGVYNKKGLEIFVSKNRKKYTNPTLAVVEIKNLVIVYKDYPKKRELMIKVSDLLLKGLRGEETLARIEFNKFCVVYNDRDKNEIRDRLLNFEETLNSDEFDSNIDIKLIVNFGVYESPKFEETITDVKLAESSISLSPIKDKNIYYYCDDVTVALAKQNRINEAKQVAFDENRFVSYIQPKVSLATGEVIGGEILCRWVDEMQNPIYSPAEFIPIFEENGFIKQIDDLMFKNACLMAATLVRRGYNDIIISVNLSRADIEGVDIVKKLLNICNENQVFPKNIELEITESAVMNNSKLISNVIMQLRQAGFRVSMDDFGKEYSSLSSLVDNPFDTIKIDSVFFRNGLQTEKSANIAKDILVMLSKLNVEIVCEGVETKDTVDKIAAITKDVVIQGFYFSKPIPTYQFESFVETKFEFDFPEEEEHFYDSSDEELAYLRNKVVELEEQLKTAKRTSKKNHNYQNDNIPQQQVPYGYPYPPYGYPYPPQYPQQPQQDNNAAIEELKKEIENLKNSQLANNNSFDDYKNKKNSSKKTKKNEPQPEPKTEDEEYEEYIKQFDEPEEVVEEIIEEPADEIAEEVIEEPQDEIIEEPKEEVVEEAIESDEATDDDYEDYIKQFDNPDGEATEVAAEQSIDSSDEPNTQDDTEKEAQSEAEIEDTTLDDIQADSQEEALNQETNVDEQTLEVQEEKLEETEKNSTKEKKSKSSTKKQKKK